MTPRMCVCGCGQRAVALHHVVTQAELRRWSGDPGDTRNMVAVAELCHVRHHRSLKALHLDVLPDEAFEFARELMGAGPAYEWLRRHYQGQDPRLQALMDEWERAHGVLGDA